ncbi:MAG: hypothetical protein V4638_00340 [Bacteroidota bacterium]
MKKLIFITAVGLTLLTIACNKFLFEYNSDFEGTWKTIPVYDSVLNSNVQSEIVIDGKEGSFKNACQPCGPDLCNCIDVQFGKAVVNLSNDQIRIGSGSYPLTIDEEPYYQDTVWVMKVHGLTYYKQ